MGVPACVNVTQNTSTQATKKKEKIWMRRNSDFWFRKNCVKNRIHTNKVRSSHSEKKLFGMKIRFILLDIPNIVWYPLRAKCSFCILTHFSLLLQLCVSRDAMERTENAENQETASKCECLDFSEPNFQVSPLINKIEGAFLLVKPLMKHSSRATWLANAAVLWVHPRISNLSESLCSSVNTCHRFVWSSKRSPE